MRASQVALAAFGFVTVPHGVVASNLQQPPPLSPRDAMPDWKALGCYVDKNALQNRTTKADSVFFTIGMCKEACFSDGFQYAGAKAGNQCWCGTHVGSSKTENQGDCDIPCPGYSVEICGGFEAFNIFEAQTGGTSTAPPTPTGSSSSSSSSIISSSTSGVTTPTNTTATVTPSSQSSQPAATGGTDGKNSGSRGLTWIAAGLAWLLL